MKIKCPESTCRAENEAQATACVRCQTPLQEYTKLFLHPAHLFNQGLAQARANHLAQARDLFAALVLWCPMDAEARNALAMACFAMNDLTQAQHHWECVLKQSPTDPLAQLGISALQKNNPQPHGKKRKTRDKK